MKIFTRLMFGCMLMFSTAAVRADAPSWAVEPSVQFYQYNMSVVAVLDIQGFESLDNNDMVAAFSGSTCRGWGYANTNVLSRNYVFLTIYSNATANEVLTFQIYDASADILYYATPDTVFENNGTLGTINDPFVIGTIEPTAIEQNLFSGTTIFPNPFTENIRVVFPELPETKTININDVAGRLIYTTATETNKFTWNGKNTESKPVSAGLYFLTIYFNTTTKTYPIIKN